MKYKKILSVLFLFIFIGLYFPDTYSQVPTYTCTLANNVQTASNVLEFDIYLLRTGTNSFPLGSLQCGILFNNAIKNGGTITPTWVPSSADPILVASVQSGQTLNTATAGCLKIAPKFPSGGHGTAAVISNVAPGTKVGRVRLTNSVDFASVYANFSWNFTASPYNTVVTYDDGVSNYVTCTVQASHLSTLSNPLLPDELSTFTSNIQGRNVVLNWETKTEKNSNVFQVERSLVSNSIWSSIGSVKAQGLSNSPKEYSFSDTKLQSGKYQYRLKMVDNDGTYQYSAVESAEVSVPKDYAVSQNYPNPFNPTTKIDYQVPVDAKVLVDVYNLTGQKVVELVNQNQVAGYYTVTFGTKLASGVYIYRFNASDNTGKNFTSIKKMILLK